MVAGRVIVKAAVLKRRSGFGRFRVKAAVSEWAAKTQGRGTWMNAAVGFPDIASDSVFRQRRFQGMSNSPQSAQYLLLPSRLFAWIASLHFLVRIL